MHGKHASLRPACMFASSQDTGTVHISTVQMLIESVIRRGAVKGRTLGRIPGMSRPAYLVCTASILFRCCANTTGCCSASDTNNADEPIFMLQAIFHQIETQWAACDSLSREVELHEQSWLACMVVACTPEDDRLDIILWVIQVVRLSSV
jgi:hypothetical protein